MGDEKDLGERLADMEIYAAHQEHTISELSDTVSEQWAAITKLIRRVDRLQERFITVEEEVQSVLPDRPPPHY